MTATNTTEKKTRVKRVKVTTLDPNKRIYILSREGALILDRDDQDNCTPVGIVEPASVLSAIAVDKPLESGIMAKNVLWFNRTEVNGSQTKYRIAYQFDPAIYDIKYKPIDHAPDFKVYNIALPFVQFYCTINKIDGKLSAGATTYLSCTPKGINKIDDEIFHLAINNVSSSSGSICWGWNNAMGQINHDNPFLYGQQLFTNFFSSFFNNHLGQTYPIELRDPAGIENAYEVWHRKTQEDPSFILRVKYQSLGRFSQMLSRLS